MAFFKKEDPKPTSPKRALSPSWGAAPIRTTEVFTPSIPALRGFVGREREMKDLARQGLRVPGTQIVVWGESGAGKSSLVNKVLEDEGRTAVKTACTPDTTYESILAAAFNGTGAFTVTEKGTHTDVDLSVDGTIGSDLIGAKVATKAAMETGESVTRQPIVKDQLTPQRLLKELGQLGMSWVIEDFHKVEKGARAAIAHALKVFSDDGNKYQKTTIIILGVSTSVDELLARETNIGKRLVEIPVPPLGHEDLGKILDAGETLLNLDFSLIRDRLLTTSVGTASITHALALLCCDEHDLTEASRDTVQFSVDDYNEALEAYVRTRSGSLRPRFLAALKVKRVRTYKNTELILRALTTFPEEGATAADLFGVIRQEHPTYPRTNLTRYIAELQSDERGALVRRTKADLYRFDEPLQHAFAIAYFRSDERNEEEQGASEAGEKNAWLTALDEFLSDMEFLSMKEEVAEFDDAETDLEDGE